MKLLLETYIKYISIGVYDLIIHILFDYKSVLLIGQGNQH